MTRHTKSKDALAATLAALIVAVCIDTASANTPRTFPFTESFELIEAGTQLVGSDGWYGSDPAYLTVVEDSDPLAAPPPFPHAAHTRAAAINGPAELRFQNTTGRTNAYVDLLVKPIRGDRPKVIPTANPVEYALYFNATGRMVVHHGDYSWNNPPDYLPFQKLWTQLDHAPLSTSEWARVTITLDYRSFMVNSISNPRQYIKFFQVKLNGVPLTHPIGYKNPGFTLPPPPQPSDLGGSWFICADGDNWVPAQLDGFGVLGAGAVDDLFIHDSTNVPTYALSIGSTYPGAQGTPSIPSAASYGYGTQVVCSVTNSPVLLDAGSRLRCIGWTNGTGTVPPVGVDLVTTVTVNRASSLQWDWRQEYLLDTAAGGGGTVDTPDAWHTTGTDVAITALPDTNMVFGGWTGDVPSAHTNDNPLLLTMDRPRSIMATFHPPGEPPQYTSLGTPHAWLESYGVTNNYDQAELEDWDEDGAATWEEYLAGTDPTDPSSVFQVLSQGRSGGMIYVTWYGTTNSGVTDGFGMERSHDLRDWSAVVTGGLPRAADGTNVWWDDNPPATGKRFYRPFIPRD